jgi:hypothetical protein
MKLSIKLLLKSHLNLISKIAKITKNHIQWFKEPKDCFFYYGSNWCPGWALGKIELPIVPQCFFYLIRDASGDSPLAKLA